MSSLEAEGWALNMKIFLSAVSGQFRDCRNALASDLRAVGVEVTVQEDFQQHGRTLLEKLEAYIDGCDRVIAAGWGCLRLRTGSGGPPGWTAEAIVYPVGV